MNKLPDYRQCVEIRNLMLLMGIDKFPLLPFVDFIEIKKREFPEFIADPIEIQIDKHLNADGIEISFNEVRSGSNGLYEYKGRKVVAYIYHQGSEYVHGDVSTYRYHLCDCSTQQYMRSIGRQNRYVVTRRADGWFWVQTERKRKLCRLKLCGNCKTELRAKGINLKSNNLTEYFEKYDTYVPKTIRNIEAVRAMANYAPNHEELAKEYKRAVNYRCQLCGVDCSDYKHILHLHHKDGEKGNNDRENLAVLCVDCHSSQPLHSHMMKSPEFQEQSARINYLRRRQGIISIS